MGISVFVLGKSGTGKSTSLEKLDAEKTVLIKSINKPLPFKSGSWKKWDKDTKTGSIIHTDNCDAICKIISGAKERGKSVVVIDDFQYLMANEFMRSSEEVGFSKFTRLAKNVWNIIMTANDSDDDLRVYMLSHTDEDDQGNTKAKTIGKLLDEKICLEGLTTVVLRSMRVNDEYIFSTQNNGRDTCKSPKGMFTEEHIPNDLAMVDDAICDYYEIKTTKKGEKK